MSENSNLLDNATDQDSTPERSSKSPFSLTPKRRISDSGSKAATSAWNEEVQEISLVEGSNAKEETVITIDTEETTFITQLSPGRSSQGKGDTPQKVRESRARVGGWSSTDELASPEHVSSQTPTRHSSASELETQRENIGEKLPRADTSSGKMSEISSLEGRSATPGSNGKSQRDKIRERIQAAKERVAATANLKSRQLKIKSPTHHKFDTQMDTDEADIEEALRRRKEFRDKWKKIASTSLDLAHKKEAYDFFTKEWEDVGKEEEVDKKEVADDPDIIEEEEDTSSKKGDDEEGDEIKLVTTSELVGSSTDWMPLHHFAMPEMTDWDDLREKQRGLLFCPSSSPVPIEEKLEPDTAPRFMEDEGLYVGKKLKISSKSKNKLEQRIMASGSERLWFGEDGEIHTVEDPLNYTAYRVSLSGPVDPLLKVEYEPAKLVGSKKDELNKGEVYLLEVDVAEIKFKEHPLFGLEQKAGERLREACQALEQREGLTGRLAGRLRALRNSRAHALATNKKKNLYKEEIKKTREEWFTEGKRDRELLAKALEQWKELKNLREKQGFSSTPLRLQIISTPTADLDEEWQAQLEFFMNEAEEEAMDEYSMKIEQYEERLEKWRIRKELKEEGEGSVSEGEVEEGDPKKPRKPNRSRIRAEASRMLAESLKPPDEPILSLRLIDNAPVDETINDPKEIERRAAVAKCALSLALRYNGREVGRIQASRLSHGFVAFVQHRFSMRIQQWPDTLSLQLLETGPGAGVLFGKKMLAEIFIPVPESVNTEAAQWQEYEFTCTQAKGSSQQSAELPVLTSGSISVRSGWAQAFPRLLNVQRTAQVSKPPLSDVEKLKEWADSCQLDPNDPDNADFFEYLKTAKTQEKQKKETRFLLNHLQAPFDFCQESDLLENPRLKLLMLRDRGQPEFRGMKAIPLNEKEIPADVFKQYEKRVAGRGWRKIKGKFEGPFEAHRLRGKEYLEALRDAVLKQCRASQHNKTHRDVILEEPVPDIGTLGLTFMKWLQPKRPLRPTRKERKKIPVKSLVGQEVEIIVNVVRAFEVPVRKDDDVPAKDTLFIPVRPFVEVTFQGHRLRTTTAEGPNPTWNQDLHIPLKPPNGDISPGGLNSIMDSIHCHLYDETVVDLIEDDREREMSVHHRLERHWLGSLRIPFAALYVNSRMEGTFELYSPPVLLGYDRESKDVRNTTFLTLFITVHPPLHPPAPFQERLESSEELYMEQHLDSWQNEVAKDYPNRNVTTLVIDTTGKSICVTRFFRPIKPPVLAPGETTPEMAARFVSMIPIVSGNMLFPGLFDVWLTADQIVRLLSGGGCDHAVLLCCFLSALGMKTWLALGTGTPRGPSAYVLAKDAQGTYKIWDPPTARSYSTTDTFCPLHRIHCLINDANIWVNVQKEDSLRGSSLEPGRRSEWWAAFGRSVAAPPSSVQPPEIEYSPTSDTETRLLQDKLEKQLRDAVMRLRPTSRTIWNRYCTASMRKLLPRLEKSTWNTSQASPPDHIQDLQHILTSYKMCGFPINMPYTNASELIEAVKATGVHLNDSPDMEFAMAVYVHPFPNNVLSVWIYVASLVRRR